MTERRQCAAIKADGVRCGVKFGVDEESQLCWHHDPALADERRRAASAGGKITAAKMRGRQQRTVHADEALAPPTTAEDAMRWASWATWAAATGTIDKGTAREVCGGIRTFLASLEKAEYESALEDLKSQVRELKGERLKLEATDGLA